MDICRYALSAFLVVTQLCAFGQTPVQDEIVLHNGTVYYGYISQQDLPGKKVTISPTLSINYVKRVDASVVTESDYVQVSTLPSSLQSWLKEHRQYTKGSGDDLKVKTSTIRVYPGTDSSTSILNAVVIEDGDSIAYIYADDSSKSLDSKEIKCIRRQPRGENEITGIVEELQTLSGTYSGQVVTQDWGKSYRLQKEDGCIQVVPMKDLISYSKKSLNNKVDIFEQNPFLEIIETKSGARYEGLMVKQNYGSSVGYKKNSVSILDKDSKQEVQIEVTEISRITRSRNTGYNPQYAKSIGDDEFLLCNKPCVASEFSAGNGDVFFVNDNEQIELYKDSLENKKLEIKLETKDIDANKTIILIPIAKQKKDKKTEQYGFRGSDLMMSDIIPQYIHTDANGITERVYHLPSIGKYLIYRKSDRKVFLFEVKE